MIGYTMKVDNLIEAMFLRGYEQTDLKNGNITFVRNEGKYNTGDTQEWTFEFVDWQDVRDSLVHVPLWEPEEITEYIDTLIELTENERIERNLHIGINRGEANAEYELGNEHENLEPISDADIETHETFIQPEGHFSFYCKNLSGTSVDRDTEAVLYHDFESAVKAYVDAEKDGKILGYKVGDIERVMAYFNTVDMQNYYVKNVASTEFFDNLDINEREIVRNALQYISPLLDKDNTYYKILEGVTTVASSCIADISKENNEWGSWVGHIVNVHIPQDYIDIDINGNDNRHEVVCKLSVIHANEILSEKQVVIKTNIDNLEESIRCGMNEAIKQLNLFMREAIEVLDTDNKYLMRLYSPCVFGKFSEHYLALENAGYTKYPIIKKDIKKMNSKEMRDYIQNYLKKNSEELICTSRVLDSLATTMMKMIESGQFRDANAEVEKLLVKEPVINFIKQRIPVVTKVSDDVQNSVLAYFEENLKNFTPIEICRKSNHPEDDYLYAVIAKQNNGEYACWTSWNQKMESLNYGHYGLADREAAFAVVLENFNDITDEIEKYGPEKSIVAINVPEKVERTKGETVVIPFTNRKGR